MLTKRPGALSGRPSNSTGKPVNTQSKKRNKLDRLTVAVLPPGARLRFGELALFAGFASLLRDRRFFTELVRDVIAE